MTGTLMIWPFLTLQMREIGLTYGDVSLIYGLIPAMTFMVQPSLGTRRTIIALKVINSINSFCNVQLSVYAVWLHQKR